MAGRRYFELSTAANPALPVPIDEAQFIGLRNRSDEFDLFLWVDGQDALAGHRDVRRSGATGPFLRASSRRCPGRRPDDDDLRPAAARTVLALVRHADWMTPSEAFRTGNPEAPPCADNPDARAAARANAYVSMAHGRACLDYERDHETWESFALQRKTRATTEASVRFRPGRAAAERLGLDPVDLRWCAAWSEPADDLADRPDAMVLHPVQGRTEDPQVVEGLPAWDTRREPQLVCVGGIELIVRDAIVRPGQEAVLLFGVHDVQRRGPATLRTALVGAPAGDGGPVTVALESLQPGPRIQVPGAEVLRLRAEHQDIPRGMWIEWGCVAIRLAGRHWDLSGDVVRIEVLFTVALPDDTVVQRPVTVPFRVVRG